MAHLDAIRKDMIILEKSEFANLRSENAVRIKFKPVINPLCLTLQSELDKLSKNLVVHKVLILIYHIEMWHRPCYSFFTFSIISHVENENRAGANTEQTTGE